MRRARALGVDLNWLTFDEYYGAKPGFLHDLAEQRRAYVGEVPKSFACFTAPPAPGASSHWAADLVRHSPVFYQQPWPTVTLARQTVGEQPWQAKMAPIWLRCDGVVLAEPHGLLWARNEQTGEEKYFISAGAADALGRHPQVLLFEELDEFLLGDRSINRTHTGSIGGGRG